SLRNGSAEYFSRTRQYSIHAARTSACSADSVAGAGSNDSTSVGLALGDGLGSTLGVSSALGDALADALTVGLGAAVSEGEGDGVSAGVQAARTATPTSVVARTLRISAPIVGSSNLTKDRVSHQPNQLSCG
ncbi:MAG TPA: hypothetical protein K8V15_08950, partial [Tessaracoccus flavescens]|nr:hypothetical protein [Tessaracoccus flavescens]